MSLSPGARIRRTLQTFRIALRALRRNKLRSGLTALGIIIGVAAVVAMAAVGNGAQARITGQISALGENLLTVFAGASRTGGVSSGVGSASTLTLDDYEALDLEIRDIQAASPEVSSNRQVVANGRNWSTSIVGVSPVYLNIRNWNLSAGRMFDERDVRAVSRVAVIGSKTAQELFGPLSPLGQSARIKGIPFQIIGVLESKGAGLNGQNQDDRLLIPYTTAMKRINGDRYLRSINIQVSNADRVEISQEQITSLLRQRHQLAEEDADDFNIFNQKDIAETAASVTDAIRLLLGAIASLSLVVGGIGIMNIMLVSVTERTREIGLRIAVGAQPGAIKTQFLVEAITLSVLGGVVGILLGYAISAGVGAISDSFKPIVTYHSIVMAFGVSFCIGVFFGYVPARKAASLNPIDALRYE
jgi:putative ABC transport system permease protein